MSDGDETISFSRERVDTLLARLEDMVAGEIGAKLPISPARDELDAISHGVNALADELRFAHKRATEAEHRTAEELVRAKELAEDASEAKSVFLRTASHEIRSPIAAILSIADVLAIGSVSDDDRVDLVDRLRANSRALLSLVGNVLDMSRLDADKMELALEVVAVVELVREVVQSLDGEAKKKRILLRIESDGSAAFVESDRLRLRQVLVNLVGNAVKFTAQGGVLVSISTEGERVVIDVTDTGIGVHPDQRAHLFEPFAQANSTIARVHGGFGLGLALSSRLAEWLGATLSLVWSEPGKGSTFRVSLAATTHPLASVDSSDAPVSVNSNSMRGVLEGVRVLLTDDNPDLQVAIGRVLKMDGASISFASSGNEAVELVRGGNFDVVVMDLLMPGTNGLDATRILRSEGCRIPIIAISADASPETRAAAVDAGCDGYLCKPFEPSDLTASIRFVRRAVPELVGDVSAK